MQRCEDDCLRLILLHLSPLDLVRMGMVCQGLAQLTAEPVLWGDISFPAAHAPALTDQMLLRLLTRTNAVICTRKLSLRRCTSITGAGLKPLMGSRVLEVIDLRLGIDDDTTPGPITGLTHSSVSALVDSIVKIHSSKLEVLLLRRQRARTRGWDDDTWDMPWRSIIQRLRSFLEAQKRRNDICCDHCELPFAGRAKAYAMRCPPCVQCRKFTCELGSSADPPSCPTVHDCTPCGKTLCSECDMGGHCDLCGDTFCNECREVSFCDACRLPFCGECREVSFCDACRLPFCGECREVSFCDACRLPFCEECREVIFCDECEKPFCNECREVNFCEHSLDSNRMICEHCERG